APATWSQFLPTVPPQFNAYPWDMSIPLDGLPRGRYRITATCAAAVTHAGTTTPGVRRVTIWLGPPGRIGSATCRHACADLPASVTVPTPPLGYAAGDRLAGCAATTPPTTTGAGATTPPRTSVTLHRGDGPADLQAVAYEGPVSEH